MKIFTFLTVFLLGGSLLLHAEPSVYGNTNGFTSSKNITHQDNTIIRNLQYQVSQQKEQIEGLRSIVEGLSATVGQLKQGTYSKNTYSKSTNRSLHDMSMMIDRINQNYVTKEEFKNVLNQNSKPSNVASSTIISNPIHSKPKNTELSTADSYTEGVRLFVKKRFNEAKKRFVLTEAKGYKAAPSNYYLGEIAYYTKQYGDAIFYFKKSAGINDKTSYIDTLLLHTAISLEKKGERNQAKAFYENIVANYNGRKTASIAREKLKNL